MGKSSVKKSRDSEKFILAKCVWRKACFISPAQQIVAVFQTLPKAVSRSCQKTAPWEGTLGKHLQNRSKPVRRKLIFQLSWISILSNNVIFSYIQIHYAHLLSKFHFQKYLDSGRNSCLSPFRLFFLAVVFALSDFHTLFSTHTQRIMFICWNSDP